MPMKRSLYPDDWEAISQQIRFERAGGQCEQCGLKHGQVIIRSDIDAAYYITYNPDKDVYTYPNGEWIKLSEIPEEYNFGREMKVILTVHHIGVALPDGSPGDPDNKMDCRPENLIAYCQRCHLLADQPNNVKKRRQTHFKKKEQAKAGTGQVDFFEVIS